MCNLRDQPLEQFHWVLRIIQSCINTFQADCAMRIIELFHEKYKDDTLTNELRIALKCRYSDIHSILN